MTLVSNSVHIFDQDCLTSAIISFVVRLSAWPAIRWATSNVTPFSREFGIPVALKGIGEIAFDTQRL